MSYRVRYTFPDGRAGHWMRDYATCEDAQRAIDERRADTGFAYAVEEVTDVPPKPKSTSTTERLVRLLHDRHARGLAEYGTTLDRTDLAPEEWAQHAIDEALDLAGYLMRVKDWFAPEPGSTAAHHVEILRTRIKELEAEVKTLRERLNETLTDNDDIHLDLARAIQLGDSMHQAMTTAQSRFYVDWGEIKVALAEWTAFKDSLAASPQGTAKASEAPRDGGDSDRRRLEALERYLEGDALREVWKTFMGPFAAGTKFEGQHFDAPTLAALADKLMRMEDKL